jgi:hypothetical protein
MLYGEAKSEKQEYRKKAIIWFTLYWKLSCKGRTDKKKIALISGHITKIE